jgi:hypothetical protein
MIVGGRCGLVLLFRLFIDGLGLLRRALSRKKTW